MKALLTPILFMLSFGAGAQTGAITGAEPAPIHRFQHSFGPGTRLLSFGMGLPNLYRINYNVPDGYSHVKTTGFGPLYARFEIAASDNIGISPAFGYGTFHYSYFGWAYHPGYQEPVIYYDDVNTMNLSLVANLHFNRWINNPRLDVYAGGGVAMNYLRCRYGNIPPYKTPESKTSFTPAGKLGARYYTTPIVGLFAEAGYDGLSVVNLGFSVRF